MFALGAAVRDDDVLEHAVVVARETMERARRKVEILIQRLLALGYVFADAPLMPVDRTRLDARETIVDGPLPLSLRAFYEFVGEVDLRQSLDQLVQWYPEERRARATDLEILGEEDPLVVSFGERERRGHYFLAEDECHKAGYSGGENYHLALPDPRADFEILGMYDIDELFVPYLRATFAGGGFRGPTDADEERAWRLTPQNPLTHLLADGLLDI